MCSMYGSIIYIFIQSDGNDGWSIIYIIRWLPFGSNSITWYHMVSSAITKQGSGSVTDVINVSHFELNCTFKAHQVPVQN